MTIDITEIAKLHGERLLKGKYSTKRIARMFGINKAQARQVRTQARLLRNNPSPEGPPEVSTSSNPYLHEKKFYLNPQTDTYVFTLPGVPRPVVIPGQVIRDLHRAYSNFDRAPATINECAREFGLPRQWVIRILQALGFTHDSLPFTDEEIGTRDEGDLVEEAMQLRKASLYKKLERRKWRDIQDQADKWADFETHILRRLEEAVSEGTYEVPHAVLDADTKTRFAAVVTPTDLHFGKYSDEFECGEATSRDITRARLVEATNHMLQQLVRFGRPDMFVVGVGSDYFHVDNYQHASTRGTPQDTDGNIAEVMTQGCELMTTYIDLLRQVAPVKLKLMSGNHDRILSSALLLYLKAWYKGVEDVDVHLSGKPRQYLTYGNNLMCFAHGDGAKKTSDLARLAAVEEPLAWGMCEHKVCFTGHLHYERVEEDRGFIRYQLPSLSGTDRWHHRMGYTGTRKVLSAVLVDANDGVSTVIYGKPGK